MAAGNPYFGPGNEATKANIVATEWLWAVWTPGPSTFLTFQAFLMLSGGSRVHTSCGCSSVLQGHVGALSTK